MMRALIFALSLVTAAGISMRGAAWMAYEEGMTLMDTEMNEGRGTRDEGRGTKDAVRLMQKAARLDPFNSEYAFQEYEVTQDLAPLERAIRLEPTRAAYHMYYGLRLYDREPGNKDAVREICRAAELKPYSKDYREVCEEFKGSEG